MDENEGENQTIQALKYRRKRQTTKQQNGQRYKIMRNVNRNTIWGHSPGNNRPEFEVDSTWDGRGEIYSEMQMYKRTYKEATQTLWLKRGNVYSVIGAL